MAKVTLYTFTNLDNPASFVSRLNENFSRLSAQVDLLLSRDGESPNALLSDVNMNAYRIINLPLPVSPTEPARHGDIQQYVDQAEEYAENSEASAVRSEIAAILSETALEDFYDQYGGAQASDPVNDLSGDPVSQGFFYYNTTNGTWRFYREDKIMVGADVVLAGTDEVWIKAFVDFPQPTLLGLSDVSAYGISNNQILQWNTGQGKFLPIDLSAENVSFTSIDLPGSDVQTAIDNLLDRTSLGKYDISFWCSGLMENNETLFRAIASRTFWIPAEAPNSVAGARVAADAETTLVLKKNDVQFGTITFEASGTVGTFSVPGETVFNPGDVFSIHAPLAADTALRDTSFTIAARR